MPALQLSENDPIREARMVPDATAADKARADDAAGYSESIEVVFYSRSNCATTRNESGRRFPLRRIFAFRSVVGKISLLSPGNFHDAGEKRFIEALMR
jgi:hypothetical protein